VVVATATSNNPDAQRLVPDGPDALKSLQGSNDEGLTNPSGTGLGGCAFVAAREAYFRAMAERAAGMVAAYKAGSSLQQIGYAYGLTRERIRQIITKVVPIREERQRGRRAAVEAARAEALAAIRAERDARAEIRTCFVCWRTFKTSDRKRLTAAKPKCSKRCATLYWRTRHFIDRAHWLKLFAKSAIVRNAYGAQGWAARTLAGIPPKRASYYKPRPDSEAGKAYAEVCRLRVENSLTELSPPAPAVEPDLGDAGTYRPTCASSVGVSEGHTEKESA